MKRLPLVVSALAIVAGILAFYLRPVPQKVADVPEMSALLEQARVQASTLSMPAVRPVSLADWQELVEEISARNNLQISVRQGSIQQAELVIAPAAVSEFVEGLAELQARGLGIQSIRLLSADQPGKVRAEPLKVVVLGE